MVTQADVNLALSQLLNPRFRGAHPKAHEVITKLWNAHRVAKAPSITRNPSMADVFAGYVDWSNKPHNAKWVRKIDGTPIANDICVCIFERLKALKGAG